MKTIKVEKYQCEYCGRIFEQKYLCQLHEKRQKQEQEKNENKR